MGVQQVRVGPVLKAEPVELQGRGPQRRVTDATLRETRDIYLSAEQKPTDAVHRLHSQGPISYSTAARWVKQARERATYPPRTRRHHERINP